MESSMCLSWSIYNIVPSNWTFENLINDKNALYQFIYIYIYIAFKFIGEQWLSIDFPSS